MLISIVSVGITYFGGKNVPKNSGWYSLSSELQSHGVLIHQWGDDEGPTHLIEIDYVNNKKSRRRADIPRSHRILIATEPVTVNPIQFSPAVSAKFSRVVVPSEKSPKNENTIVAEGGYFNPMRYPTLYANDGARAGCAIINENKFSFVKESNYLLRSKFITMALGSKLTLTVAGLNWTRGLLWTSMKLAHHFLIAARARRVHFRIGEVFSAFHFSLLRKRVAEIWAGVVPDNVAFLSKFKVAIVIENESSYVSEKLHAALVAGCQCVYVGPNLNPDDFPGGFLIQSDANVSDIMRHTELALRHHYSISGADLKSYLTNSEFAKQHGVARRNAWVAKSIGDWIGSFQSIQ